MSTISSKLKVLVVDDEEPIRDYLRVLLVHAGYEVRTAGDGREALEALAAAPVDVILLDLMMPVLDGTALLAILGRDERLRSIPVIVLSAVELEGPTGVAAVLVKPSSPSEIRGAVGRVLRGERRGSMRFPAAFPIHASPAQVPPITTHDVSRGGLAFDWPEEPRTGEIMTLTVELPAHGVVLVEAEVRHVATSPVGWRVGARLIAVRQNADGLDAALSLLERLKK